MCVFVSASLLVRCIETWCTPRPFNLRVSAMSRIDFDRDSVARFCRSHHIRKLALFGSVLRDDFGPDSDVDLLVEFEEGQAPSLFGIARMERELSPLFGGRRVDLRTPQDLGRHMRDRVVSTAEGVYAA